MKIIFLPFLLILQNGIIFSQSDVDSILNKVSQQLNQLENIRYTQERELNYSSENYRNLSTWIAYYGFQNADTIAGFNYQIEDSVLKQVFNGAEKFELDKKGKIIQVNDRPTTQSVSSLSAIYNSIITLRNILPVIIGDQTAGKAITDTIISSDSCLLITINTGKRRIQNLGKGFDAMATKNNFIYKIIITKKSGLPFEMLQVNDTNNDFIRTRFSNIETNVKTPPELSWYYSTYMRDYKPVIKGATPSFVSKGSAAPEWMLEVHNSATTLSLKDLKGKVVLLDFWIKNCGPCIQSVPHLNELQEKFKGRNFRVVGINSYDSKETVSWFSQKHNTRYSLLLHGKEVAEKYGVSGYPAFFVIDKEGKVIYANSGFDESMQSELESVIEKAL